MIKLKPVFLGVLLCFWGGTGFVLGQNVPVIENLQTDPVQYCYDPVAVAPAISIQNIQVDEENEGMKVSIIDYIKGEDLLVYDVVSGFSYNWNENSGVLEIRGIGSDESYEDAVSKVYYQNISNSRTPGIRSFSINLVDADYLPATQHFYRFVPNESITWTNARIIAESESMEYYGLQGYLATIRSKEEQDFIYTKTEGTGWIGGSDAAQEGTWKWVVGPDAGVVFWSGNAGGGPVNGEYSHWGSGEPNNSGDEDYAHILYSVGVRGYWNDLKNPGSGIAGYIPQGFLIEYGGMPGDPDVDLSAVSYVDVRDSDKPELDESVSMLFCGDKTQEFNIEFTNVHPNISLRALNSLVTIQNANTYNPIITVPEYGSYTFFLKSNDVANCEYIDTLEIEFHNQPEAAFSLDEDECYGYNLQLAFDGITEEEAEFTWYYNAEVFISGTEIDSVTIPLGFDNINRTVALKVNEQGCTAVSLPKTVNVKPSISVTSDNMSGCSPITTSFAATSNNTVESYLWDFDDGTNSDEAEPEHLFTNSVDELLAFDVSLTVLDQNGCENTAVYDSLVKVYPVPTADFDFEPQEILITAPEVEFENLSHAATDFYWDFGDSTSTTEKDPNHRFTSLGFYSIWLQVANDFTCTDTIAKQIRVTFDKLNPPNAFSPNATLTENREFRLYADGVVNEGYSMLIFNRWGELIFQSNTQQQGWDGKMQNGKFAPAGVYTWVLNYYDFSGDLHKQKGNVTLLF